MDNFKPFWSGTVTVAPDSGGVGTVGMTIADLTDTPPTGLFDIVVRRPVLTNGNPKDSIATILRGTVNPSTGVVTGVIRNLGGATNFAIAVGDEVYQYMGSLLQSHGEVLTITDNDLIYPATATGIQAAIDYASTNKIRWVYLDFKADVVVSTPLVRKSYVGIKTGPYTRLGLPANASSTFVFQNTNIFASVLNGGQGFLLSAGVSRGATEFTLPAGSVASLGIVAGSLIRLASSDFVTRVEYNLVRFTSGDTVYVEAELNHSYTTSDGCNRVTNPLIDSPLSVEVYQNGNTGTTSIGITAQGEVYCHVADCKSYSFASSSGQGGIQHEAGFGNIYERLKDELSGTAGQSAIQFNSMWNSIYRDIYAEPANFGIQWNSCGRSEAFSCRALRTVSGRLLKFQNCRDFITFGCEGSGARGNGQTGLMINGPVTYNLIHNSPITRGNYNGIQTNGDGVTRVKIVDPIVENNTNFNLWLPPGDTDITVINPGIGVTPVTEAQGFYKGIRNKVTTTDATPTIIANIVDTSIVGSILVNARIIAHRTDGATGQMAAYNRSAAVSIKNGALVGSVVDGGTFESNAAWNATILFAGNAYIEVTGAAGATIDWEVEYDIIKSS